jgi:integrase
MEKTSSGKFREMIRINGRAIKSPSFIRKSDASAWKRRMLTEKDKLGAFGTSSTPDLKFSDFVNIWLEKKVKVHNSFRTLENYRSDIKNHLLPNFGYTGIGFISSKLVTDLISKMKNKGLTNRTINKVIILLKTILNDAVRWDYIPKSPIFGYQELKVQDRSDTYLNDLEIKRLIIASHSSPLKPIIITALNSGMRLGEILGLQFDRIDLERGHIHVTRTLTRKGIKEGTKTSKKRIIPMNATLKELFWNLFKSQKSPIWCFARDNGEPFDVNHISQREFKKLLLKAQIPPKFRFHDLRHTYASHFVMKGGDLFTLQKILGHSSVQMTQRYAHLSHEYLDQAVKIIDFRGESELVEPNMNQDSLKNVVSLSKNLAISMN